MSHVKDYFAQVEQYSDIEVRRVYLATDEPLVSSARNHYR